MLSLLFVFLILCRPHPCLYIIYSFVDTKKFVKSLFLVFLDFDKNWLNGTCPPHFYLLYCVCSCFGQFFDILVYTTSMVKRCTSAKHTFTFLLRISTRRWTSAYMGIIYIIWRTYGGQTPTCSIICCITQACQHKQHTMSYI